MIPRFDIDAFFSMFLELDRTSRFDWSDQRLVTVSIRFELLNQNAIEQVLNCVNRRFSR